MNQFFAFLVVCLAASVNGFVPAPAAFSKGQFASRAAASSQVARSSISPRTGVSSASNPGVGVMMMAAKAEEATRSFWEGEWVCADCGYIYDIDDCGGLYLEEQKRGFVCPQCRGPRRRFAKKVGNQVGITQDGGDAPILLFSFLGLGATVAFGYWFAGQ
ncbi:unnamed protein product [Ectocarpus sp. 12 AP-2014]